MKSKTGGKRKKYLEVGLVKTNKESYGLPDPGLHQDFNKDYIKSSKFGEGHWPITYYFPLEGHGIHLKVHKTKGSRGPPNKPKLMWIPVNSILIFDPTWFMHRTVPWDGKQPFPPRRLNIQHYGIEEMLMEEKEQENRSKYNYALATPSDRLLQPTCDDSLEVRVAHKWIVTSSTCKQDAPDRSFLSYCSLLWYMFKTLQ